jgi:YaiO family outer membrane protein
VGVGDTYTFDADWYGSISAGAGDGASYLPRYRIDAFLHRKLLERRNLVANLGTGFYRAPDGHIDRNVSLGATYYFDAAPLVLQGEVRFTHGSPGGVDTRQQFVAATWGRQKQTTATVRYGWGEEGYQSIGGDAVLTNFRSKELIASLRHWLGADWGLDLAAQHYRNPTYRRTGLTAGVFWQVP